jgi:hypothetical protein
MPVNSEYLHENLMFFIVKGEFITVLIIQFI